jgi:hypothetical protein
MIKNSQPDLPNAILDDIYNIKVIKEYTKYKTIDISPD